MLIEFNVPDFRLENALSVGAKIVKPWFELLSCELIRSDTCVAFSSFMNVVNCPAFSRTFVMFVGPDGAGDIAV